MVSFNEVIDLLLEKYWSGWDGRFPRLSGWGKDVPFLDRIGRKIRNRKPIYATKDEVTRILKWKRAGTGQFFYENNTDVEVMQVTKHRLISIMIQR